MSDVRPDLASEHDHGQCITRALDRAAEICARRGVRLTSLRRRVLELVWESHGAVKAYDLLEKLGNEAGAAKPPTVYRALDFLIAQGLVHRLESVNAFVGCPNPGARHDAQFLICERCGTVAEFEAQELRGEIARAAAAVGFTLAQATIELRGACRVCTGTS